MQVLKRISTIFLVVLLVQCSKNPYVIEKGKVGTITTKTKIEELSEIFKKDSLVTNLISKEAVKKSYFFSSDEYVVYNKKNKKMLAITPITSGDSVSKIKSIQIFNSAFKTEKGLSLKSTFREITQNYEVNKVETSLTSATLFIDELNATIAIDKKELGLSPFSREQVTLEQIPDIAKIKYFTIWFN